jgi:hypothetical protein
MRPVALIQALLLCGLSAPAFAQVDGDPISQLKACSQKSPAERLECLEELSRRIAQSPTTSSATTDNWVLSATTSPVNYSPIVVATTSSRSNSQRASSLLSISCRNGRTELVVTDSGESRPNRSGNDLIVAHQINDRPAIQQRWNASASGTGATFRGDVVGFLQSLPDRGEMSIRVFDRQGHLYDGRFLLDGVSIVREKVAAACKWPAVVAASP